MSAPVVATTEGKINGKICKTEKDFEFYAYKGIPFAKPPVGELRFSAPQQPDPWEGVRDGTKDANICPQFVPMADNIYRGNEDCLYLNVFTPRISQNTPLPVMVSIHGGGFVSGSGACEEFFGADYLVEKDVVIVSFNYRLGILGFLALDTKEAPGNMGLKDQVAALKWVQKNIHNFGGDPTNVTIFGLSAGGASVEYLLLSPMAKGLFHKAISQSGSSLNNWAQNKNIRELAAKIPQAKGESDMDDKQLLKYLKDMPIDDLISLSEATVKAAKHKGGLFFGFVPTIEKKGDWEQFLSDDSYKLLSTGNFNKVPLISGFCSHEGMITIASDASLFEDVVKEKNFIEHFPFTIDDSSKLETINRLEAVYLDGRSKNDETDDFAIDFYSDTDFIGGVYTAATLVAQSNVPVYLYMFAYDGNINYVKKAFKIDRKGACHGDDFTLTLKIPSPPEKNSTEELIQDQVTTMWTNFAKQGNPTPKKDDVINTIWEPFTKDKPSYLLIDHPISMKTNFNPERTRLYNDYYEKRSD